MKNVLLILIISLSFIMNAYAQVEFQNNTFEEIDSDKPIFIDVYTTWCGPCKKMDQTTFQDSLVSAYMNENFTCLKWDAEDPRFIKQCKSYEVNSYPTYLFFTNEHKLITHSGGYTNTNDFYLLAKGVIDLVNKNPFENVSISSLSLLESVELLRKVSWYKSPNKIELLNHTIALLEKDESSWKTYYDLIAISAHNEIDLKYIGKIIFYHEPPNALSFNSLARQYKIHERLNSIFEYKLDLAMKSNNYIQYLLLSQLQGDLLLLEKPGRFISYKTKKIEVNRLAFYKYHRDIINYKPLADSLVTKYISPNTPEMVSRQDQSTYRGITRMKKQTNVADQVEKDSTSISYFKGQHINGVKLGDRLDDIASAIYTIYHDEENLNDALEYSNLAFQYVQLPEYLITKSKIQYKQGDKYGAIETLNQAISTPFSDTVKSTISDLLEQYNQE